MVVGWKVWYADGSKYVGKTLQEWQKTPDDGVILVMLYYNRHSVDGGTRYRRICQGDDYYWQAPGKLDVIYGHGSDAPELVQKRYPGASVKRGSWTDDAHYRLLVDGAMSDHVVSELGIEPEPNTEDR